MLLWWVSICPCNALTIRPDARHLHFSFEPRRRSLRQHQSFSTVVGTATTLGSPQAVETRIAGDIQCTGAVSCMVVVSRLLTTATTRPAQSSTGAPEAP